jgi:hypothetical protein
MRAGFRKRSGSVRQETGSCGISALSSSQRDLRDEWCHCVACIAAAMLCVSPLAASHAVAQTLQLEGLFAPVQVGAATEQPRLDQWLPHHPRPIRQHTRPPPFHLLPDSRWTTRTEWPPQSQLSAPPFWYSVTLVSKKFFSFFRSMASDIQGNGLSVSAKTGAKPSWAQRRLAMKCM